MPPKLRYFHDGAWHDIGGVSVVESFRARQKNHSPKTSCDNQAITNIKFDEWRWGMNLTPPSGTAFEANVISGKLESIYILKPGLYAYEGELLWDTDFSATHGMFFNDFALDRPLARLNERIVGLSSGADSFSTVRRMKQLELDAFPGNKVQLLIHAIQDSGSTRELASDDTFFEVHRLSDA